MGRYIKLLAAFLALAICLGGCAAGTEPEAPPQAEQPLAKVPEPAVLPENILPEPEPEPEHEPEPEPISIRLTAVGDNLLHNTLSIDSEQEDGSYDFHHLYEHIVPIIQGSDLAFINQEVMLTGEVSAYPNIAAPGEAADALIDAGFNIINLATNHSLDKGVAGLSACLENVHQRDFDAVLGAFRTEEESKQLCVVEKQGIRFGFLSYTYGLNGYSLPGDKTYMIALIDEEKIRTEMEQLRPLCDYLIVSMHWGNEYQTTESDYQTHLAQLLCNEGADLIIGTHPHVLQPMKWLEREDGHKTLCVYSLGNFISGQHKRPTMLGGILQLELKFASDGALMETVSAGVIPTVTHYKSKGGYTVYPLSQYTKELAEEHGVKNYEDPLTLDYLNRMVEKILGDAATEWQE